MKELNKNWGLDWQRELKEQSHKDWNYLLGSSLEPLAKIPLGQRDMYLPKGELQNIGEDKMDCASRAPNNILETQFNWLIKNKLISISSIQWLENEGYMVDGQFEVSDAFVAILSGTTRSGNSLKAPCEAIRKNGLIPKSMLPQVNTFSEYHNPQRITQKMLDLGKRFSERFSIHYERVYEKDFEEVLKRDVIDVGGYAWPIPEGGEYHRVDYQPNHAFMLYKTPKYFIFDNYIDSVDGDFIKKLAPNYDLIDYGYRIFVSSENRPLSRPWYCVYFPQFRGC